MPADWDLILAMLKDAGLGLLKENLEAAREDLQKWGVEIAKDALRAVREQRPDLADELVEQAKALAEVGRIRLVGTSWDRAVNVFLALAKVAVTAVAAVA